MIGAGIVALAVLLGMATAAHNHLDGAQTLMACIGWALLLASLYHGAVSILDFFGIRIVRRRR